MRDWTRAFVESPLAGSIQFNPGPSRVQVFNGDQWIFTASVKQEEDSGYKVWEKIDMKKYPVVCPYCGAPHNPNDMRCEYCGGYMNDE